MNRIVSPLKWHCCLIKNVDNTTLTYNKREKTVMQIICGKLPTNKKCYWKNITTKWLAFKFPYPQDINYHRLNNFRKKFKTTTVSSKQENGVEKIQIYVEDWRFHASGDPSIRRDLNDSQVSVRYGYGALNAFMCIRAQNNKVASLSWGANFRDISTSSVITRLNVPPGEEQYSQCYHFFSFADAMHALVHAKPLKITMVTLPTSCVVPFRSPARRDRGHLT